MAYNGTNDKVYSSLYNFMHTPETWGKWYKVVTYNSSSGASVLLNNIRKKKVFIPGGGKKGSFVFTVRTKDDTSALYASFYPRLETVG